MVTQVLSELEFTVELSYEPFVTVKKLTEEPFDALVVDCSNEQNASLLFKGMRNSSLNHSSLCVAVTDGQAGVANAFRIGANLVLTKPINIEQSKNTLRVAKGLLRKNTTAAKTAAATQTGSPERTAKVDSARSALPKASPTPSSAAVTTPPAGLPVARSVPSSLLEAEQVKAPGEPAAAPRVFTPPSSLSTGGGAAAAPTMAPERPHDTSAPRLSGTLPSLTQEPIISEHSNAQSREIPVPSFATLTPRRATSKGRGGKIFLILACLAVAGAGGYFGWKKYQPLKYVHFRIPAAAPSSSANGSTQPVAAEEKPSPDITETQPGQAPVLSTGTNSTSVANSNAPEGFPTKETIEVAPPAEETEKAAVETKPEPIQVSNRAVKHPALEQPAAAPVPPQLDLPSSKTPDSALAGIVAGKPALPRPAAQQESLRISQGITQGLLMKRVSPVYPPMALQMRKEGSVELLASISKTGSITKVKVLSGDATLAKAAVDAVRQWKYRPYLLNGEPVDIETQVTIIFRLPH
jgi:protein TonB